MDAAFPGVAHAAVQLHGLAGDRDGGAAGVGLGHRRGHGGIGVCCAAGDLPDGVGDELAGDADLNEHVGAGVLDGLEGADGAVAPGFIRSEITDGMYDDERSLAWLQRNTPLPYTGTADDFVGAVLWLVSDAGRYVTGQTVVIDGGWTAR